MKFTTWSALQLLCAFTFIACRSTESKTTTLSPSPLPSTVEATPPFLQGMRQLTFSGLRAGEGYFSADGRFLIFQSEREPGNPFYQMYVMNLASGQTHRVSPGYGKTSCGWIHPSNQKVLFSSTHADPEWKKKAEMEYNERKNPKQRYSWNFDPTYDIYEADMQGHHLKNLTHSQGYDAEGSYSPDGQWIAFASNRAGFDPALSTEDKKHFEQDPSYMMDIYIMRADGRDVKRLTTEPGYDGGPFFSPDGQHIVYRHFAPDGRTAEIYSMKTDGSERKPLTHLGVMSWAPFYHPSGDYLIFASNKYGYGNFELFLVDTLGTHEPIRVTNQDGFDGLPVFAPDGQSVLWTHSNETGEAQLYRAEWNDALARQQLGLKPAAPQLKNLHADYRAQDSKQWIEYLASPYFEGRLTGNPKELEYAQTLANVFRDLGLKTEIQDYEFTSSISLGQNNHFDLQMGAETKRLMVGQDWIPLSYSKAGEFPSAPLIFAGYGIVATAAGTQKGYDSYSDLDVHGKWVVVFSGLPANISTERRFFLTTYARLQHKAMAARQRGALGLIVLEDSTSKTPEFTLSFEGRSDDVGVPILRLSPTQAKALLQAAGTSVSAWTQTLSDGKSATLTPKMSLAASATVDLQTQKSHAHNVLGLLEAPGATQTVIVGAHLDHLGHGEMGNSLTPKRHEIHPGADDNASGVTGVMEVAQALAPKVKHRTVTLKQNVLFALWTGEEIGILGSSYFAKANTKFKLSASLNMDMIGRYREALFIQGLGSAPEWKGLLEPLISQTHLNIHTQEDPYLPSDALTFYMKEIPSIMLFTGSHPQYHTPEDLPGRINYEDLGRVAQLAEQITERLAGSSTSPVKYQKVEGDPKTHPNQGLRLYLGTIPDYSRELKAGVAISGTSKDSPAEKAGLMAGDIILELGGIKIKNLYDYVYCLQALKANERTKLKILRAGAERELDITPLNKAQ